MKIHEVKVYQEFDAPASQIWEAMNDHVTFGKMMGQKVVRIVDSSDPANVNGVGSIRSLGLPVVVEETIMRSEKSTLIEYKITKGTPLHHHYGSIGFTDLSAGRSSVTYTIELGSRIPLVAAIVRAALQKGIADGLRNHARRLNKKQTV